MTNRRRLWLASSSPRRKQLLEAAGIPIEVMAPEIDDAGMRPGGVPPMQWVMSLAYLKARSVADRLRRRGAAGVVRGADTVCVLDGVILGQPADADAAGAMIRSLRGREHHTWTGVCLLPLDEPTRTMFADRAVVSMGHLTDEAVDRYVESKQWVGKAGGYNLAERLEAGWPLEFRGDPTSVMGLPMERLRGWLERWQGS